MSGYNKSMMIQKFSAELRFLFSIFCVSILASCGSKKQEVLVQLASNRTMGVSFQEFTTTSGAPVSLENQQYIKEQVKAAIQSTYQPNLKVVELTSGDLLETPENFYTIASEQIDDLFRLKIVVAEDFQVPLGDFPQPLEGEPQMDYEQIEQARENAILNGRVVRVTGTIRNGKELKLVGNLDFSTAADSLTMRTFEERFEKNFRQNLMEVFKNPNLFPTSDPKFFADRLFEFSQMSEKNATEALNCDNSKEILQNYMKAKELYELAKLKGVEQSLGTQQEVHSLNSRIEESQKKADILILCEEDKGKNFEIIFDYGQLNPEYESFIQQAFERAKLGSLLPKYTRKPVEFRFSLQEDNEIALIVKMRFDQELYRAWTAKRIPPVYNGYHVISLDPYYALMQTLVYMRSALPNNSPKPLRIGFSNMTISLQLHTLLNGAVTVGVDGRYLTEENRVSIGFPKSLILSNPSFEKLSVGTRSDEIFQEKGWMALSSCKTLDGNVTEDGLVLQFFGIPCKL